MNNTSLTDMGNLVILLVFGLVWGVFAFLITVFIEALIMKRFFKVKLLKRLGYSFIANLSSIVIGLPFFSALSFTEGSFFEYWFFTFLSPLNEPVKWLLSSFVVTVLVEFLCLAILLKIFDHIRLLPAKKQKGKETTGVLDKYSFWPPERYENHLKDIFIFSILANLVSYTITLIAPYFLLFLFTIIRG
jgi:hypothetical protein